MSKWANCSFFLSKSLICSFAHKKQVIRSKKKKNIGYAFCMLKKKIDRFAHFLFFNEWCEQIAQVAHQKWATMSDLLRLLTKNEQIAWLGICSLVFWANHSFFAKKWVNNEQMSNSLIFGERPEGFAHTAHFWWATWAIHSHSSLRKREWANCSFFKN